jgi:predicted MFS family arabinose efflux permease
VKPATGWHAFTSKITVGAREVWADPALRLLVGLNWLAGFYIVPEALAAPYAAGLGAGAGAVGWLMAADPIGSVIGAVVFGRRWVPESTQIRALGWLGVAAGVPLIACMANPGLLPAMTLFAVSGLLATGYNIQGTVQFVRRLSPQLRAQGSGLNSAGLITVQGVGALLGGVLSDVIGPAQSIAVLGAGGAVVATGIASRWRRVSMMRTTVGTVTG